MKSVWSGRLTGTFFGSMPGRIFELSDGSRWRQESGTDEPVYRENPSASLLHGDAQYRYLDVEGTLATVQVMPVGNKPKNPAGAS